MVGRAGTGSRLIALSPTHMMEAEGGEGEREEEMGQSYRASSSDILPPPPKSCTTSPKQHPTRDQESQGSLGHAHFYLSDCQVKTSSAIVWAPVLETSPLRCFLLDQKWV